MQTEKTNIKEGKGKNKEEKDGKKERRKED